MEMRELLDKMTILEEQAAQQGQEQQTSTQDPQEQAYEVFVAATIREFLGYLRTKQKAKQRKEQQRQQQSMPKRPPGFCPNPNAF
jgi:TPP-dependent indolepyruvate ferredoxin oxidoreductase alpha subunit